MSGCTATFYAAMGLLSPALAFIIIGAVFDFFDGMAARLLHVSSPIGKELDSLADVVTFGVAPSMMVFVWLTSYIPTGHLYFVPFVAFLMAAFSALRLAKFNLDERQVMGFIGLPTPANALFWGSLLTAWGRNIGAFPTAVPIVIVMLLLSCYLLVSEIPMFALKFKTWGWQGNQVKYLFLISCLPLLWFFGVGSLAVIIAWYVVLSVVTAKAQKNNHADRQAQEPASANPEP